MNYKFTSRDWINFVAMVGICVLTFGLYFTTFVPVEVEEPNVDDITQNTVATNKDVKLVSYIDLDIHESEVRPVVVIEPPKYMAPSKPTETNPPETTPPETEPAEPPATTPPSEPIPEPTEAPDTTEPEIDINMDDVELLACVIYQETGSDWICNDCRRRVADTVLNRVAHPDFPNTIYDVLTEYQQYGRFYWTGVVWPERASYASEAHAVEKAYRIAREVLSGQHSELYGKGYVWQAAHVQGTDGFWCCGHYFARG